jgi:ATP-dependent protease ClpP protease subunit
MKVIDYNPTSKTRATNDDDELDGPQLLPFVKRSFAISQVNICLDEPIVDPKYYRAVISELQTLGEHDTVNVTFATNGGNATGMVCLIEAFRNTQATVSGAIIGDCHSAGSILAMNCDQIYVAPYASMMIHNISYGYAGKDADVMGMVSHTSAWSKKLIRETYEGFLSEIEIIEVLSGKELWLDSDQIKERFDKRQKYAEKKIKAEVKELKALSKKATEVKVEE